MSDFSEHNPNNAAPLAARKLNVSVYSRSIRILMRPIQLEPNET